MSANDKWVKLHVDFLNSSMMGENILIRDLIKVCWLLAREQDWDGGSFKASPWVLASRSSYLMDPIIDAWIESGGAESVVDAVIKSLDRLIEIGSLEEIGDDRYQIPPEKWDRFQDSPQRMKNRLAQRRFRKRKKEEELQDGYGGVTDGLQGDDNGITEGLQGYDLPSVSVSNSNSNSSSNSSPKTNQPNQGGVGGKKTGKKKKAAVVPEYTPEFERFWTISWKRGHKRAAWDSWAAITESEDAAVPIMDVVNEWTGVFERREGKFQPHVSTWLNNRGWEDDLGAELAKAKGDERQVGKTPDAPTLDEAAAKKRRSKVRQAILEHAMHLMELEIDDPEVAECISWGIDELKKLQKLECESNDSKELVEGAQKIVDKMLLDISRLFDDDIRTEWKEIAQANAKTQEKAKRLYSALARRAVRKEYKINDLTDYDWEG